MDGMGICVDKPPAKQLIPALDEGTHDRNPVQRLVQNTCFALQYTLKGSLILESSATVY